VKSTAEAGKELEETAQATGLTTRSLQELRGVARASGVEVSDFDTAIFRLSRTMYAAKKGGDEQSKVFHKLGVKVTDTNGKLKNADDILLGLATGFQKMPDGAEKTAMAMEVFGRAGARMIPMLNKGEEGINNLRKSAFVMSEEQIKAGKELSMTQMQLTNMTTKLWRSAIAPLLPAINQLLKRYLAWRKENAEIMRQRIQQYIGYVIKAITGLSNAFAFFVRNSTFVKLALITLLTYLALTNTAAIATALSMARAWLIAAAPFIAIALVIAALALAFDDLRTYMNGGKSLFGEYKKALDEWLKPNAEDTWFVATIKSFVKYLEEALRMVAQFNEVMGVGRNKQIDKMAGQSDKQIRENADRQTINVARNRVQRGLPLTKEEGAALSRSGIKQDVFVAKYRSGGGGSMQQTNQTTIEMNFAPGASVDDNRKMVQEELQSHQDRVWEETAAQVSQ